MKLYYDAAYEAHGDAIAEKITRKLKKDDIFTSSEIVVTATRALIKEGILDNERIIFVFGNKEFKTNKQGIFLFEKNGKIWPDGFADTYDKLLERIYIL